MNIMHKIKGLCNRTPPKHLENLHLGDGLGFIVDSERLSYI